MLLKTPLLLARRNEMSTVSEYIEGFGTGGNQKSTDRTVAESYIQMSPVGRTHLSGSAFGRSKYIDEKVTNVLSSSFSGVVRV